VPTVQVRYLAGFSTLAGRRSERLRTRPGQTLGELLTRLGRRHGRAFARALASTEGREVMFLLNDRVVGTDAVLRHNDRLIISRPMGGG